MSALVVVLPGLQTTVQDLGRWGHQAEGVPVAGAMDPFAHRHANALVGNPKEAATLEVTLSGPELRLEDRRRVAVAGAEFELLLDGVVVPPGRALMIDAGSTLRFGDRRQGARAYIAVEGGCDVPTLMGSRATHLGMNMGGWFGRALARGDRLPLGPTSGGRLSWGPASAFARSAPADRRSRGEGWSAGPGVPGPDATETARVVRVLAGPQHDRFTADALETLIAQPYTVGIDSNRMAYRLEGPRLRHRVGADIISDATAVGSLQVPASGQPVLLMADRQTTGGYAKIATVISADIGVAAQAAPGDRLQFRLCDRATALTALIAREQALLAVERDTA